MTTENYHKKKFICRIKKERDSEGNIMLQWLLCKWKKRREKWNIKNSILSCVDVAKVSFVLFYCDLNDFLLVIAAMGMSVFVSHNIHSSPLKTEKNTVAIYFLTITTIFIILRLFVFFFSLQLNEIIVWI